MSQKIKPGDLVKYAILIEGNTLMDMGLGIVLQTFHERTIGDLPPWTEHCLHMVETGELCVALEYDLELLSSANDKDKSGEDPKD